MEKKIPESRMKKPTNANPSGELKYAFSSLRKMASISATLPFVGDEVEEDLLQGEVHGLEHQDGHVGPRARGEKVPPHILVPLGLHDQVHAAVLPCAQGLRLHHVLHPAGERQRVL